MDFYSTLSILKVLYKTCNIHLLLTNVESLTLNMSMHQYCYNHSATQFSHALLHLMKLLKCKDPHGVVHPELVIRDFFI